MARKTQTVILGWEGPATIRAARTAMSHRRRIEIDLPQGTHHALFVRLHPEADRAAPETFDARGGPEMLERMALVAGLQPLARLAAAAKRSGYRVEVASPDPLLTLSPPPSARAAAQAARADGR